MSPIFSGTVSECLADFLARFPDEQHRRVLTEFIGIKHSWPSYTETLNPQGERRLRLEVFLDLLGYRVKEFQRLSPVVQQFAQAIGLGLLAIDEASTMLDYPDHKGLFRFLLHGTNVFPHRRHRLQRFVETSQEELHERLAAKRRELRQLFPTLETEPHPVNPPQPPRHATGSVHRPQRANGRSPTTVSVSPETTRQSTPAAGTIDDVLIVHQLAHLLGACSDLSEWVNRQPAAANLWDAVRDLVGSDRLQVLSHTLCSMKGEATPS